MYCVSNGEKNGNMFKGLATLSHWDCGVLICA